MAFEAFMFTFLAIVVYFVVEYFRRKPQIDNIPSKSVLITGCDTGFGHLLAKRLDGLGCRVFAACYTQKGADDLRSCSSSRLETVLLDVTKTESIMAVHKFITEKLGPGEGLWGLVNNAGVVQQVQCPPEYLTIDDLREVMDVNLLGLVDMTLHFLPLLVKSKGRIVNMSSSCGRLAPIVNPSYTISKYGVEAFSDGLRPYLRRHGVHVAILEPGVFATSVIEVENGRGMIQRGYDRMSAEDRETLGPNYVDQAVEHFRGALSWANQDLDLVVDAYQHALFAVNPKARYTCGFDARIFFIPLSYMPSFVQDFVFIRVTKDLFPQVKLSKLG